jgi:hypothetical protein
MITSHIILWFGPRAKFYNRKKKYLLLYNFIPVSYNFEKRMIIKLCIKKKERFIYIYEELNLLLLIQLIY